jgi:hypothetical protein
MYNLDVFTMHFVEFYYFCPTNAQNIQTISVSKSCSIWGDPKAFEGGFSREKTDEITQRDCVLHYNKALGHTALSFQ